MVRFLGMWSPNVFSQGSRWHNLLHGRDRLPFADALVRGFWRISAWSAYRAAGYSSSINGRKLQPELGLDAMLWCPSTVGVTTNPGLWADIQKGDRVQIHRSSIRSIASDSVELDDGTIFASHAIVLATGFQSNHDMFSRESLCSIGVPCDRAMEASERTKWEDLQAIMDAEVVYHLPLLAHSPGKVHSSCDKDYHLHRFIAPTSSRCEDRSIVFLGMLRGNALPIMLEAQALWATAYLFDQLSLPSQEDRERETARVNAWIRRRYMIGRKVPFAVWEWAPV